MGSMNARKQGRPKQGSSESDASKGINLKLEQPLRDAISAFRKSQELEGTITQVIKKALVYYLTAKGFPPVEQAANSDGTA